MSTLQCSLSECLSKEYRNPTMSYKVDDGSVRVLHKVLSAEECSRLITEVTKIGLTPPPFDESVRKCTRRHTVDVGMSEKLDKRIRAFLPEIVMIDGIRWKLSRFTHHWRYVHYTPGGKFIPHWDGAKMLPNHEMTVFTCQIYLNENFEGGSTRFYTNYKANRLPSHDIEYGTRQLVLEEHIEPTVSVVPETGSILLFDHAEKSLLHDAEEIRSGEKFILRGDILYSAIDDDIPALKNNPCITWCERTAARKGTKNYIGQVWVCECAKDDIGAKVNSCACNISEEKSNSILSQKESELVGRTKAMKPIVVLVSGKRASGKDFISNLLGKALEEKGFSVCRSALGNINKKLFAEEMNVDYEKLMNDRKFKEQYRVKMVEFHRDKNQLNPSWCIDAVMQQCGNQQADVLVLSDLRMKEDISLFAKYSSVPPILLRVGSSNEARKRRGWDPDAVKDNLPTEIDLDNFTKWTACIDNSETGPTFINNWIQNTVIPRIYLNCVAE